MAKDCRKVKVKNKMFDALQFPEQPLETMANIMGDAEAGVNGRNRKKTIWNSDKKNGVMRRLKLRCGDCISPTTTMNEGFFPGRVGTQVKRMNQNKGRKLSTIEIYSL
ncbi:hypothetical protein CEXT_424641 [Caerostris extrusa]|uniref:Uncharacterized protein n=1 Tax=Caerostris extrusa TaxID=172846 RepID=A0AAV4V531_CAEEX|nr:hypothetical protein CEXT_424641 [Caerostris extrusa]